MAVRKIARMGMLGFVSGLDPAAYPNLSRDLREFLDPPRGNPDHF